MRVAIDAMGGDHAPGEIVQGAVQAARSLGVSVALVGNAERVQAHLDRCDARDLDVRVVHAESAIAMDELRPARAIKLNADNSMSVAAALVRRAEADAFVTVGNTGAAMTAAAFGMGRIHGVRRPALVGPLPTLGGPCAVLDVGANAEARPSDLLAFGVMGAAYASRILDVERPRVGLLTIGEERGKGNNTVQSAYPLLEASQLDFIGNIEGRDIPLGGADVAVTDGFTGNIVLKFAEGIGEFVRTTLREEARRDPLSAVGALLMTPALGRLRRRWDYRAYGGAMLLGVRGVTVIGHGRSDAEAIESAIRAAKRGFESGLTDAIAHGVEQARAKVAEVEVHTGAGEVTSSAEADGDHQARHGSRADRREPRVESTYTDAGEVLDEGTQSLASGPE